MAFLLDDSGRVMGGVFALSGLVEDGGRQPIGEAASVGRCLTWTLLLNAYLPIYDSILVVHPAQPARHQFDAG
jgi:hypothetical protein